MAQDNVFDPLEFIQKDFKRIGFGIRFNADLKAGVEAKAYEIAFGTLRVPHGPEATFYFTPEVKEKELKGGFYIHKGYNLKLEVEGKDPVDLFIKSFFMTGMKMEQAKEFALGGTVLHTAYEEGNGMYRVFSQVDTKVKDENGNYPVTRVRESGTSVIKLLSAMKVVGKDEWKNDAVEKLANGKVLTISRKEGYGQNAPFVKENVRLYIHERTLTLATVNAQGEIMKINNAKGNEPQQREDNWEMIPAKSQGQGPVQPEGDKNQSREKGQDQGNGKGLSALTTQLLNHKPKPPKQSKGVGV